MGGSGTTAGSRGESKVILDDIPVRYFGICLGDPGVIENNSRNFGRIRGPPWCGEGARESSQM